MTVSTSVVFAVLIPLSVLSDLDVLLYDVRCKGVCVVVCFDSSWCYGGRGVAGRAVVSTRVRVCVCLFRERRRSITPLIKATRVAWHCYSARRLTLI